MIRPTVCVLLCLIAIPTASAEDWPTFRGPRRDGISRETGLLKSFPAGGPKLLWTFEQTGVGYSGPAVVGDRLYILGAEGSKGDGYKEFALAIDVNTGKTVWKTDLAGYDDGILLSNWGHGPRSTPTVADGMVFALGAGGDLVAFNAADGAKVWSRNLKTDFGGGIAGARGNPGNTWGYSESPTVHGGRVLVTPGGKKGAVVALNPKTGDLLWQSAEAPHAAAYSSIVPATICGVEQYVQLTAGGLVGLAAADGKLLWSAQVVLNPIAMIPTPIVSGDQVYASTDYGAGSALVKVVKSGDGLRAEVVYENKKFIQNHHGGVVLMGGHVFGWSGNSTQRGWWVCQDLATGKEVWTEEEKLKCGSVTAADGAIYCYTQDGGILCCIEPTPKGFTELGRFTIPRQTKRPRGQGKIWTHPVIAGGKLFLRDLDLLFCFDLKK